MNVLKLAVVFLLAGPALAADRALVFTKASGYEHSIVVNKNKPLSIAEQRLKEMLEARGFIVEATKDGTVFDGDLTRFKMFVFFTHGDLFEAGKDGQPPMTPNGKEALLKAVAAGTPFVGLHSACMAFVRKDGPLDPYLAMVGGEFQAHTWTQDGTIVVVPPALPGLEKLPGPVTVREEWTKFRNLDPNIRVILALGTKNMDSVKGKAYQDLPFYPVAWVKMHGKGRVFYNSMGQEQPVWDTELFKVTMEAGWTGHWVRQARRRRRICCTQSPSRRSGNRAALSPVFGRGNLLGTRFWLASLA